MLSQDGKVLEENPSVAEDSLKDINLASIQAKIGQLEVSIPAPSLEEEEQQINKSIKRAIKQIHSSFGSELSKNEELKPAFDKLSVMVQEMKRNEFELVRVKKQAETFARERDILKSELVKTVSVKVKLENLCRELQKENKKIREDSLKMALAEQEKREELSKKFESSMQDIKEKMDKESEEQAQRLESHEKLRDQFKTFIEQYDLREQHFNSLLKSKELENQLAEAKLEQQVQINAVQAEKLEVMEKRLSELIQLELSMKAQVSHYSEKCSLVQEALDKRDEFFTTFKADREMLKKAISRLEKELNSKKSKMDTMSKNIIEMAEQKTTDTAKIASLQGQVQKLEKLCRALQDRARSAAVPVEEVKESITVQETPIAKEQSKPVPEENPITVQEITIPEEQSNFVPEGKVDSVNVNSEQVL